MRASNLPQTSPNSDINNSVITILTSIKPMEVAILNIKLTSCIFFLKKPKKSPNSLDTLHIVFKINYFYQKNQYKMHKKLK